MTTTREGLKLPQVKPAFLLRVGAVVGALVFVWWNAATLVAIASWLGAQGVLGAIGLVLLVALVGPTMFPDSVFGLLAGAVYGPFLGALLVSVGAALGSALAFALGRGALRGFVAGLLSRSPRARLLVRALERQGASAVVPLRLLPFNPSLVAYVLAVVNVPWRSFLLASYALLPSHFLTALLGYAAVSSLRGSATHALLAWTGLALGGVSILLVLRLAIRTLQLSRTEGEAESE